MRYILTVVVLCISVMATAQRKNKEYYPVPQSNDTLRVGDRIQIGPGIMPEGGYRYIAGIKSPDPNLSGLNAVIKIISRWGNDSCGYKYLIKVWPYTGIMNYYITLPNALEVGEIKILHK